MPCNFWESMATLFASFLRFLNRWNPNRLASQAPQNPYPFGTREWTEFAAAQATQHELMALRIADLEAQVQQNSELVGSLEVLAASQDTIIRDLRLQNRTLRDGPDPEVFERIWEKLHAPLKKPAHAHPGRPGPEGSGLSSSDPVAPAAGSTRASGSSPAPPQGKAIGQGTGDRSRPVTLAEELEGHLDQGSEDESEEGDL